jgi:hypothetical protein
MAEDLKMVHTRGRGLLRGWWLSVVRPKVSFWPVGSTSPRNCSSRRGGCCVVTAW